MDGYALVQPVHIFMEDLQRQLKTLMQSQNGPTLIAYLQSKRAYFDSISNAPESTEGIMAHKLIVQFLEDEIQYLENLTKDYDFNAVGSDME